MAFWLSTAGTHGVDAEGSSSIMLAGCLEIRDAPLQQGALGSSRHDGPLALLHP